MTGAVNVAGALGALGIVLAGLAPPRYVAAQGTVLERAGRVHVERVGADIWVGGNVVTCIAGKVAL